MKILMISWLCFFSIALAAQEQKTPGKELWGDFKTTLGYMARASYLQFTPLSNLAYAVNGTAATWYAFEHDDRLLHLISSKQDHRIYGNVADLAVLIHFPVVPVISYGLGRYQGNERMIRFAMEIAAATYLSSLEATLISRFHVHDRPSNRDLSKWETEFRGDSSFPSGHVMPMAVLTFKTLQFYGPLYALAPAALTVLTAYERVHSQKHYPSDVISGIFIAAIASEGVRVAGAYKDNHPFYRWAYEHQATVGILRQQNAWGPRITFSY